MKSIFSMRQTITRAFGLATLASIILPLLTDAAISDVFKIQPGTTKGGCDNIDYDLATMFDEASKIIETAAEAFDQYEKDFSVRKIALAFFGVQTDEAMRTTKDDVNADRLERVKDGFDSLKEFCSANANVISPEAPIQKAWLFCDSDWVEKVDAADPFLKFNSKGKLVEWVHERNKDDYYTGKLLEADPTDKTTPRVRVQDVFSGPDSAEFVRGQLKAYLSKDVGLYRLGDPDAQKVTNSCEDKRARGETSLLTGNSKGIAISLCLRSKNIKSADTLDTSKGEGTFLNSLDMKSLTFIHEFYHASKKGRFSRDLESWQPPADIKPNSDGSANGKWPGDVANFQKQGGQADHVTDLLLLALATGKDTGERVKTEDGEIPVLLDVTNNPQSYAWAAVAVYLAKNGAKLDYSTGKARPLDANPSGPAAPANAGKK